MSVDKKRVKENGKSYVFPYIETVFQTRCSNYGHIRSCLRMQAGNAGWRRGRNILSRNDLIQLEGVISRVLGGGTMEIKCENDITVRGVLSGRMKKHRIKVMVGDRVQVSVSPYDTTHGLITYRF